MLALSLQLRLQAALQAEIYVILVVSLYYSACSSSSPQAFVRRPSDP